MKSLLVSSSFIICALVSCNDESDTEVTSSQVEVQDSLSPETEPTPSGESEAFDKTLALQGISFQVTCSNHGSLNELTITPSGLEVDNKPITVEADGSVTSAEVADLNGDGSPEIYISVTSAGSGSYGSLVAYAANNKKSLSSINLAEMSEEHSKGFMGHDEFRVVENSLVRRFPTYNPGDSNASPTGKTCQLQYTLAAGEASWQLKLVKVSEF